jgi:hypothetical protein
MIGEVMVSEIDEVEIAELVIEFILHDLILYDQSIEQVDALLLQYNVAVGDVIKFSLSVR